MRSASSQPFNKPFGFPSSLLDKLFAFPNSLLDKLSGFRNSLLDFLRSLLDNPFGFPDGLLLRDHPFRFRGQQRVAQTVRRPSSGFPL